MSILQFVLERFNCLSLRFSVETSRHSGALNIAYDGFSKFQFQIKNNLGLGFRMENFRDEGEKRRFLTKTARGSPMKKVGTS